MSEDRKPSQEGPPFLERWSQRKRETRASSRTTLQTPAQPAAIDATAPDLAALDRFTLESDWRAYFQPAVDENVRRTALKKLFSDPHFNVMDGLDVYVDDYSLPNVLPEAMLGQLRQAQNIIAWAKVDEPQPDQRAAQANGEPCAGLNTLPGTAESGAEETAIKKDEGGAQPPQTDPRDA